LGKKGRVNKGIRHGGRDNEIHRGTSELPSGPPGTRGRRTGEAKGAWLLKAHGLGDGLKRIRGSG